jgi:hypothetical protein
LLVPFVYGYSFISDVCAVPPAPGYMDSKTCAAPTKNPGNGLTYQTCCWKERNYPEIGEKTFCQTCSRGENVNDISCTEKVQQSMKLPETTRPQQEGGVLEDPESNTTFAEGLGPNFGGVLEQPTENNMTFSKSNVPFPQANDTNDNMTFSKSNVPFPQAQANDSDDNTNNTLVLQQSDIENDRAENNTEKKQQKKNKMQVKILKTLTKKQMSKMFNDK